MRGLTEHQQHELSQTAPPAERQPQRRFSRRLLERLSTLFRLRPAKLYRGNRSRRTVPESPSADPVTPELDVLVRAAFPPPQASEALRERVADICSQPETAPCGVRQGPPSRPGTRNGLQPSGWGRLRSRWGWIGILLALAMGLWLPFQREDGALAAVSRAMESAPVIHVVGATEGRAPTLEVWFMRGVGLTQRTSGEVVVDDYERSYVYDVAARRVEIRPSELTNPRPGKIWGPWNGTTILRMLRASAESLKIDWVERGGKKLRRVRVPGEEPESSAIYIDPQTDRIVLLEHKVHLGGPASNTQVIRHQIDYPDPATVDRRRFRFTIPEGVTVIDRTRGPAPASGK